MFTPVIQFSVFLTNKPGILAQLCGALAEQRINLLAVTLMDSVEHGVFRLVAANPDRAREVLKALNVPLTESEVLSVDLSNSPGALADLCARLNADHISIRYAYVTSGAAGGRTTGIFKVDNTKKALAITSAKAAPGRKETRQKVTRGRAIKGR